MAVAMRGMLAQHLGASLAADTAASGVNYDWMQEFSEQAAGLGVTFRPTILGFGAVLDNLSAFIDNTERPVVIVGAATVYIVLWIFVAGGIIDRYARDRPTRTVGFFASSGVFFFRFLRLAAVQWIVYAAAVRIRPPAAVRPALSATSFTRSRSSAPRSRCGSRCTSCSAPWSPPARWSSTTRRCGRSSKIAAACSARSRARSASSAGTPRQPSSLFLANFALFIAVIGLYALVAPGAAPPASSMWIGFAIGQLYVIARLWVKLVFWASETAFFQSRLAHAGYVTAAEPVWPDSPEADAIECGIQNSELQNSEFSSRADAMTALIPSASSDSTTSSSSAIARTALRFLAMIWRAVS